MPQELPPPTVDPELLFNADAEAMEQDCNAKLITYLYLAKEDQFTAILDFTAELLRVLRYARRQRLVRTRVDLPLLICDVNTRRD